MDKRAAVVGNGPSALGKGDEIDAHDIVIRINNYRTEGYDVGKRTDIWACGVPSPHGEAPESWILYPPFSHSHGATISNQIKGNVIRYELFDIHRACEAMQHDHPSTGALTAFFAAEQYNVTLYGFDFFEGAVEGEQTPHYYSEHDTNGTPWVNAHDPQLEKAYLVSKGLV